MTCPTLPTWPGSSGRSMRPDAPRTPADRPSHCWRRWPMSPPNGWSRSDSRSTRPAISCFSVYPVLRIWQVHQPGFTGDAAVPFDVAADHLVVRRESGVVSHRAIAARRSRAAAHAQRRRRPGDGVGCRGRGRPGISISEPPFAPASPTERCRNCAATESIGAERRLTVASPNFQEQHPCGPPRCPCPSAQRTGT